MLILFNKEPIRSAFESSLHLSSGTVTPVSAELQASHIKSARTQAYENTKRHTLFFIINAL